MSEPVADVLQSPAVGVLVQLEAEGVTVVAVGDRLKVKPIARLTPEQRTGLERYRRDILLLLRICDETVQARREAYVAQLTAAVDSVPTLVYRPGTSYVPGACYSCADPLPHPRHGRCWRCALAARLAGRAPIPPGLAAEYDEARIA